MTSDPDEYANELSGLPLFAQPLPQTDEVPLRHLHRVPPLDDRTATDHARVPVDWALVAALRAQASNQLSEAVAADRARMTPAGQQELGRAIVLDLIESTMADRVNAGAAAYTPAEQGATARAVFDSLFRLGRLQPLVDDDRVENIIITGHDQVLLELIDGTLVDGPAVAESDEELIAFLVFLGSRSEVNARSFSEADPVLHLRLDGGSRLAATCWVTPRPSVVIRRHRLMQVTLEDLVDRDLMTPLVASFLRAAIRARKSIVVSGCQGAGKTTLLRALCAEFDPFEAIGTFESEYELHLHELPEQHRIVHAWEARPGTGERGPDGLRAGEYTLSQALEDSFRFNLSRQIVGEVRGKEAWTMIKAMESSTGSVSTTHASDAIAAIRKLVTCSMESGPEVGHAAVTSKLSETVDLIVHLDLRTETVDGRPRRRRRVAEIVAVEPGEHQTGYATTHVFKPGPDQVAVPSVLPDRFRELAVDGFDLAGYLTQQQERP